MPWFFSYKKGGSMQKRLPVLLDAKTLTALRVLAQKEYRDPRAQAAVIIREALVNRGLLTANIQPVAQPQPVEGGDDDNDC